MLYNPASPARATTARSRLFGAVMGMIKRRRRGARIRPLPDAAWVRTDLGLPQKAETRTRTIFIDRLL